MIESCYYADDPKFSDFSYLNFALDEMSSQLIPEINSNSILYYSNFNLFQGTMSAGTTEIRRRVEMRNSTVGEHVKRLTLYVERARKLETSVAACNTLGIMGRSERNYNT
jgi:hypothetical protein